ncbi:MAG: sulfatase, partial [Draconibacterium sp.]|nr:sulfatase [Draconibacterium sp.]
FFVDDMGWADLGYRNSNFYTPNIDRLKDEGMDFQRAYIATPTCSPSRASILTGKEPIRIEMSRHITHEDRFGRNTKKYNYWKTDPAKRNSINWLPLEEITYAERLKQFGYYNMFIGKWHLGHEPFHPVHQGFDEQYGISNFGHPANYYPPYFREPNPLKDITGEKYLTDVLTSKADEFIRNYDKERPFMLSMWYYNVHSPHIGRKDLKDRYKKLGWNDRYANYGAMVSAMDESVGRIRNALREKGIADNTVILFTSDQGGFFTNYPLRGLKVGNTLGEGGARVPFILYYPDITSPGAICETPIQTIDVFPTLMEIASGTPNNDQIQGKSLMPLVKGEEFPERNLYFFRSYEDQYAAIISGDWKLIKYHTGPNELYNIKKDQCEINNLIRVETDIANKLEEELSEWEEEAVPPIK